jgi:hypothetical protein
MKMNLKKMIVTVTGSAVIMGAFAPVLFTGQTAAAMKWASIKPNQAQAAAPEQAIATEADATAEMVIATPEQQIEQSAEETIVNTEVAVTDSKGDVQRVAIANTGKQTMSVAVDRVIAEKLQQEVERGKSVWLLDPVDVVKNNAAKYGFNQRTDTFTLITQISVAGKGKAYVLVGHGSQYYIVELTQPVSSGHKRIWQIVSIKEASVTAKPGKPDTGSGVVGLDYNKVIKWQQNVDEGRELWRLDPMQVAKNEGKQYYGFRDNAQYTIIRKLSSSPIARHGQIDMQVSQNGKKYTMILVRPLGSDKGAIWTTYRVYETVTQPEKPASSQVVFQTDKYKNWTWYKPQYPQDMGVAVVYTRQMQMRAQQQMPQSVLDQLNNVDLTNKVALVAYLGETSSRHDIGIEKVVVKGNQMTVTVRAKSPRLNAPDTRDLTSPSDFVLVKRSLFKTDNTMNVTFVDQNGKVLGKVPVTISK